MFIGFRVSKFRGSACAFGGWQRKPKVYGLKFSSFKGRAKSDSDSERRSHFSFDFSFELWATHVTHYSRQAFSLTFLYLFAVVKLSTLRGHSRFIDAKTHSAKFVAAQNSSIWGAGKFDIILLDIGTARSRIAIIFYE